MVRHVSSHLRTMSQTHGCVALPFLQTPFLRRSQPQQRQARARAHVGFPQAFRLRHPRERDKFSHKTRDARALCATEGRQIFELPAYLQRFPLISVLHVTADILQLMLLGCVLIGQAPQHIAFVTLLRVQRADLAKFSQLTSSCLFPRASPLTRTVSIPCRTAAKLLLSGTLCSGRD